MKYFKVYELVDRQTYSTWENEALKLFNPEALRALDDLREFFGVAVVINNWHEGGSYEWRGWRTPEKAAELGAPHSQHALGNAFDCDIRGWNADDAREWIITNKSDPLLQRIMRLEANVTWIHFDLMPVPNRIRLFSKG